MASTLKNVREINIRNHSEYGTEGHDDVNSIRDSREGSPLLWHMSMGVYNSSYI